MSAPAQTAGLRSAALVDGQLHLVLNGALEAIEDGRVELLTYLEPHGVPARTINRLEVIFEELVSNAVRHGFGGRPGHSLHVWAAVRAGVVHLVFEDDGIPFDLLAAPAPKPFTVLDEAQVGGLGIAMVMRLSSSVAYEHAPALGGWTKGLVNRTTVTLSAT